MDLLHSARFSKRDGTHAGVVSPIPEPSSWLLFAMGAGAVVVMARRAAFKRAE